MVVLIIQNVNIQDHYQKQKHAAQANLSEPKLIGKNDIGKDIYLKNGRFGPYLQYELSDEEIENIKKPKTKTKKEKERRK